MDKEVEFTQEEIDAILNAIETTRDIASKISVSSDFLHQLYNARKKFIIVSDKYKVKEPVGLFD